jgi:hypothetical protein
MHGRRSIPYATSPVYITFNLFPLLLQLYVKPRKCQIQYEDPFIKKTEALASSENIEDLEIKGKEDNRLRQLSLCGRPKAGDEVQGLETDLRFAQPSCSSMFFSRVHPIAVCRICHLSQPHRTLLCKGSLSLREHRPYGHTLA